MELKDNTLITYSIGTPSISVDEKEIKNKLVIGAKFGTFNKKPVEQLSTIEEDELTQTQRISQTEN